MPLTRSMEKTRLMAVNCRSRRPISVPVTDDDAKGEENDALLSGLDRASKDKSARTSLDSEHIRTMKKDEAQKKTTTAPAYDVLSIFQFLIY